MTDHPDPDPKAQAVINEYNLLVRKMVDADKAHAEWREYCLKMTRNEKVGQFVTPSISRARELNAALECAASAARRAVEKAKEDVMRAVAEMAKENER